MGMKLNLGCGKDYIDGWVNVDFYDDSKCDVTHDLEEFPWPWEDDSVSEIRIIHTCLLYTSPSPRDLSTSRMPSSA